MQQKELTPEHGLWSIPYPPPPAVDIEKLTNGYDADGANDSDVPRILPGDFVTWTYQVTNTGEVAFGEAEVMVTDNQGAAPALDPGSDEGGDMILSPGEMWLYTASAPALDLQVPQAGPVPGCNDGRPTYVNVGGVVATAGAESASDSDPSHYCNPGNADIDIRKQAEGPDTQTFPSGSDVTFEIVVTNEGAVDLVNVVITDANAPRCAKNIAFLAAGANEKYTCTAPNVTTSFENEACVQGESAEGVTVQDCDSSTVDVNKPADTPVASVLPSSRSVHVGNVATAFATIINPGNTIATDCGIAPLTSVQADFSYQTTDADNTLIGVLNRPVDIGAGGSQNYLFALTPTASFSPVDVHLIFDCTNTNPAPVTVGLNTLLLVVDSNPVPDIVALAATVTADGIVNLENNSGVFAVATVNVGNAGSINVSADTGGAGLPVSIALCETNPATGACINPTVPTPGTVTTSIASGATPTFTFFVTGTDTVPFDPANSRIFVRFQDAGGVTRGATSVAVRTL